jgi:hypothetical protein
VCDKSNFISHQFILITEKIEMNSCIHWTLKRNQGSKLLLIIVFICTATFLFSQDHDEAHHELKPPFHKLSFVTANSLINHVNSDNTNGLRLVPVYGLNYDYMFHQKWAVGFHSDIIIQQFQVETHHGQEEIIRENPVALCGVVIYKPHPKFGILGGYGIEIESHKNLQILRFGIDYGIHLPKNWELGFLIEYDYKIKSYGSLMFGFSFSKLLKAAGNVHQHKSN